MDKPKIYERRVLEFPKNIRRIYDKAEAEMILDGPGGPASTKWITSAWNWLRQLCGGFAQGRRIWDGKMIELSDLIRGELRKEKVVVWCCYNQEVDMITDLLNRDHVPTLSLRGMDLPDTRKKKLLLFQGRSRVLVIQQAIGQMGMDLSVADTAIYYSTPPGQMARLQTEDRILSMRKKQPLLYIDLVVKGTVDEDVMEILQRKVALSDLSLSRALAAAIRTRRGWV